MKKKYNDDSPDLKEWTNKKLKKNGKELFSLIFETGCSGKRDIKLYDRILDELLKRKETK